MRSRKNLIRDYQQLLKDGRMFNVQGWEGYDIDIYNYHLEQNNGMKLRVNSSERHPLVFTLKLDDNETT